jgi:hypothetical protein
MRLRTARQNRLPPDDAKRQGHITHLAFLLLGRDAAIEFLNADNFALGARPLDLAIASSDGCARVEAELGRLTFQANGEG